MSKCTTMDTNEASLRVTRYNARSRTLSELRRYIVGYSPGSVIPVSVTAVSGRRVRGKPLELFCQPLKFERPITAESWAAS